MTVTRTVGFAESNGLPPIHPAGLNLVLTKPPNQGRKVAAPSDKAGIGSGLPSTNTIPELVPLHNIKGQPCYGQGLHAGVPQPPGLPACQRSRSPRGLPASGRGVCSILNFRPERYSRASTETILRLDPSIPQLTAIKIRRMLEACSSLGSSEKSLFAVADSFKRWGLLSNAVCFLASVTYLIQNDLLSPRQDDLTVHAALRLLNHFIHNVLGYELKLFIRPTLETILQLCLYRDNKQVTAQTNKMCTRLASKCGAKQIVDVLFREVRNPWTSDCMVKNVTKLITVLLRSHPQVVYDLLDIFNRVKSFLTEPNEIMFQVAKDCCAQLLRAGRTTRAMKDVAKMHRALDTLSYPQKLRSRRVVVRECCGLA